MYNEVCTECNEVNTEYNYLSTEYNEVRTECNEVNTKYNDLSTEYNDLSTEYNDLTTDYHEISTEHHEVSTEYRKVSTEYRRHHQTVMAFHITPHPEKSEAMLICKTLATGLVAPIHLGTDAIVWVHKSRLLGITVDDKLSRVPHMLDLKKSFSKKLDLIRRSRFLPKDVLVNFYFKAILPSVSYGLVLWGSCFKPGFHIVVSVVRKKFIGQIEFISCNKLYLSFFFCIEHLYRRFP